MRVVQVLVNWLHWIYKKFNVERLDAVFIAYSTKHSVIVCQKKFVKIFKDYNKKKTCYGK